MSSRPRALGLVLAAPMVLCACLAAHEPEPGGLDVEASIASVTLADDCGAAERRGAPGLWEGDCGEDGCPSFCQQTAVRLTLAAAAEGETVPFEVVSIRLRAMDGALVGELSPHDAQLFADGTYVGWDEQIAPGQTLHVTYDTSAPDWARIGGGNPWTTHGMQFRVEMVVRVDGLERTLEFAPAMRESEIVT
ncbi:MAG: hypothetical protein KF729_09040 [Sandaracinaceae bacterium]|nr:hypothetical protein [Sandaracinaceae bacterium]